MLKTLGIVEVSSLSFSPSRSNRVFASRRFAGRSLLEWVTRRVTDALLLDHVVVMIPEMDEADRLSESLPPDVSLFVANDNQDPISRLATVVCQYKPDAIVRVDADHPFIDPTLIDRLVAKAESYRFCDYIGYCSTRNGSVLLSQLGILAEWCRADAIHQADEHAKLSDEREDLTRFIYSRPDIFQLRLIPIPTPLDRDDLRLALGTEDDWDHAQMILDALDPESLDWQGITHLLDNHPTIRERMAALNRIELET